MKVYKSIVVIQISCFAERKIRITHRSHTKFKSEAPSQLSNYLTKQWKFG